MKIYIFILLSTFILISCRKNEDVTTISSIIPLHSGNSWSYLHYRYCGLNVYTDTSVFNIHELVNINGVKGYLTGEPIGIYNMQFLLNYDNSGNILNVGGYSDVDTFLYSTIEFKKEIKSGETYIFRNISGLPDAGTFENYDIEMKCLTNDTTIETPSGNYKCIAYKYSPNSGEDTFINYICDGIGVVKTEQFEFAKLTSSKVLISYKLNN